MFRQLTVVVVIVAGAQSQQSRIQLCDLLRNASQYNGREVTVRATLRYGFEWSDFLCISCSDMGLVWLSLPADMDDESERAFKRMPEGAGIVNVTVTGVFKSGSTYGPNGYHYQLTARTIRDVAVLQSGMKKIEKESLTLQRYGCGGKSPK